MYKWMSKNGCVTECKQQNASMLSKWIAGYVKRAGKTITGNAAQLLIERVGTDMEFLTGEMEKLIGYTGERTQIEISDVSAISSGVTVSKIFDMIDAVAQGEKEKALRLYDDLLANKESPMSILYLFTRHINILIQIKELSSLGCPANELAKRIGIPPFTVNKYGKQAGMFKRSKLLQMLETRADYEEKFKNGKLSDQLAVELFLISALTNS
jgi:DNA polymerase-3 subunit delta